jgi:polysaccharide export outer membrane protein
VDELREQVYTALRDRTYRVGGPGGEDVWRRLQEDELYLDIAEYRPVYVTGGVRNPGEITYRPGMSVRQALAIAGGVGQPLEEGGLEDEILRLTTERALLLGRIETQITNLERYKADLEAVLAMEAEEERAGVGTAEVDGTGGEATSALEEVAQRWLDARADLRELTERGNGLLLDRMKNRLEVLQELAAASEENLSFEEEEFARVTQLVERGLVPASSVAEARRGLLQSSTRALETSGEVLRLRLDMTRLAEDAKAELTSEKVRLLEAVSDGTAQLRDLERQLSALNTRLTSLGATLTEDQAASVRMELFRADSDGAAAGEQATPIMVMAPGDVLEVTLTLPDAAPAIR